MIWRDIGVCSLENIVLVFDSPFKNIDIEEPKVTRGSEMIA